MMNLRLHRDGTQTLTADQLQELKAHISAGSAFSTALLVVFIAVGPAAAIWAQRIRGAPPAAPWPRGLSFPSETDRHRLDTEQVLVCRADGVFGADDALLVAISGCQVPLTPISAVTYWSAPGSCRVLRPRPPGHRRASVGARWTLTSWAPPLTDCLEASPDRECVLLHRASETVARLVASAPRRTCQQLRRHRSGWTTHRHDGEVLDGMGMPNRSRHAPEHPPAHHRCVTVGWSSDTSDSTARTTESPAGGDLTGSDAPLTERSVRRDRLTMDDSDGQLGLLSPRSRGEVGCLRSPGFRALQPLGEERRVEPRREATSQASRAEQANVAAGDQRVERDQAEQPTVHLPVVGLNRQVDVDARSVLQTVAAPSLMSSQPCAPRWPVSTMWTTVRSEGVRSGTACWCRRQISDRPSSSSSVGSPNIHSAAQWPIAQTIGVRP